MPNPSFSRRTFLASMAAATIAAGDNGWIDLFDGRSMDHWRPSENRGSWKLIDGLLAADGPRSHLFYTGPVHRADFRNFELEVEAYAQHDCNSGVYFHTAYQESGFPNKGFEIQINNTALGEGSYRERKKTGSLYGVRNVYKQFIQDNQWFKIHAAVRGKSVQIRLNEMLVVDYVEPAPPVIPDGPEKERFLDHGTFALQCHNDGSKARFRSVRVRPLPDSLPAIAEPVADDTFRRIINVGRHNIPVVDFRVYLTKDFTLKQAVAKSLKDGVGIGVVGRPSNDTAAREFVESLKGQPVFVGLETQGRTFSKDTVALFDYTAGDSLFNDSVIEINGRSQTPGADGIRKAKSEGRKFAFGSNCEYGLRMVEECKLVWQDFFVPS
jgi:hypothetical protein